MAQSLFINALLPMEGVVLFFAVVVLPFGGLLFGI
jgi:hypothetical protein